LSNKTILVLQIFLICLTVGVNIFIFTIVLLNVLDMEYYGMITDSVIIMMFMVPFPSAYFIYVLVKSLTVEGGSQ